MNSPGQGRKPKPTSMKLLAGNPGGRPLNKNEPKPEKAEDLKPPAWLEDYAKEEWERVISELYNCGILTILDITTLIAYCQAYADWRKALAIIHEWEKKGMKVVAPDGKEIAMGPVFKTSGDSFQQIPQVSMARNAMTLMVKFAAELGMTPSSRSRVHAVVRPQSKEKPKFLFGFDGC